MSAAHGRRHGKDRRTLFRQLWNRRRTAQVQGNNGAIERNGSGITNRARQPKRSSRTQCLATPELLTEAGGTSQSKRRTRKLEGCDHSPFEGSFSRDCGIRMTNRTMELPKETAAAA